MMKPYACDSCSYSSNYKYDLKRHQKVHYPETYSNSRIEKNQSISTSGYPVQAMNLSNHVNVPQCPPNQVINIQPPHSHINPSSSNNNKKKKKIPVIHDNSSQKFDLRLKENFKLFVSDPSRSGKTVFVKELLNNLDIFAKAPPKIITLIYKVDQPIYHEMGVDFLVQDGPNLKQHLLQIAQGRSMLCIFDDLINSTSLGDLGDLFVVDGRHLNLSLVFISQRIFVNSEEFRQISQNCDYYCLFKNPRNAQEIRTLAAQMTPGKLELVKYFGEATQDPFSYLWVNLTQECPPLVKYLSHLFNIDHVVRAYNNGKMVEMRDLLNKGRTNFEEMYFNTNPRSTHSNQSDDSLDNDSSPSITPHISPSHFDEEANELELRERLRKLRGDWTDYSPIEDWDEEEDKRLLKSLNSRDVGVQTEDIKTHSSGTDPVLRNSRDEGVQTEDIKTYSSGTDPVLRNTRDEGVQTEKVRVRNEGVQFDKIRTHNSATNTNSHPVTPIGTNTVPPVMKNIGTDSVYIAPHRNAGANTSDAEDRDPSRALQEDGRMNPMEIIQVSKEIKPYKSSRPERNWRLNTPLNELISMRNQYFNYNDYVEPHAKENFAIVPYQRYDQEKAPSNTHKCLECEDVFRSVKALETHRLTCKPSVFACSLCGKNLPTRNAWQSHVRNMHQTRKDVFNTSLDKVIRRKR